MTTPFCLTCWFPRRLPTPKLRWLSIVFASVLVFAGVELWVGMISHSLTLRADSGHMLTDGLALGIALAAAWAAQRSRGPISVGNHRVELLAALINSLALLAMALWIAREAWGHWQGQPTDILSRPMLVTALLGLLVNGLNLYWIHGDIHRDLNLRGVFLHLLADLLGSVGALVAALAITFWHWTWADTLIGTVVALLIAISALPLLWQSLHQLAHPPNPKLPPGWLEIGQSDLCQLILPASSQTRTTPLGIQAVRSVSWPEHRPGVSRRQS